MTKFQIVKDNLPKINMTAYSDALAAIQSILRHYRKFFLGRRNRRGILFVDGITGMGEEYIEVMISIYNKSDGKLVSTELVALNRGQITDEAKLKYAMQKWSD